MKILKNYIVPLSVLMIGGFAIYSTIYGIYKGTRDIFYARDLEKNGKAVMVFRNCFYGGDGFDPETGKPIPLKIIPNGQCLPVSLIYMSMTECEQGLSTYNRRDELFIRPYLGDDLKSGAVMPEPARCIPRIPKS